MNAKPLPTRVHLPLLSAAVLALLALSAAAGPALALSEIKREELPPAAPAKPDDIVPPPAGTVPLPDPIQTTPPADIPAEPETPTAPDEAAPEEPGEDGAAEQPGIDADTPIPEVVYDLQRLPEPVRRMHALIVEACKTGDIERLRTLLGVGDDMTQVSVAEEQTDPVAFLKEQSGDADGQEILAILEEVLSAGFVHLDAGTSEELYVWPYFFAVPLERLTPPQRVELFKIVTAGDYEDMKSFGTYVFYRAGITPEGRWAFFVAGD